MQPAHTSPVPEHLDQWRDPVPIELGWKISHLPHDSRHRLPRADPEVVVLRVQVAAGAEQMEIDAELPRVDSQRGREIARREITGPSSSLLLTPNR